MLRLELEALAAEDYNLDLTGFDEEELQELQVERELSQDEAPAVEAHAVTRLGDLWKLGDRPQRAESPARGLSVGPDSLIA